MTRVGLIALWLLLALPLPGRAAFCPPDQAARLFRTLFTDAGGGGSVAPKRTSWAQSPKVREWNAQFPEVEYKASSPGEVLAEAGTLASEQPHLFSLLADLRSYTISPEQFMTAIGRASDKAPSVAQWKAFYSNRLELYEDGVKALAHEIGYRDPDLAARITESIGVQVESLRFHAFLQEGLKDEQVVQRMDRLSQSMHAHLTELKVALGMGGVRGVGVRLESAFRIREALQSALQRHLQALKDDPKHLDRLRLAFPRLMSNRKIQKVLATGENLSKEKLVNFVIDWIGTKEIDVLREVDGRLKWVEIKSNQKVFGLSELKGVPGHSPQQQLEEDLEIVRFLKPDLEIDLEYFTTGPISIQAQESLKRSGVTYVGPKANVRR